MTAQNQAQQTTATGLIATVGAAGGVGGFIALLWPSKRSWALYAALLVLLFGLGFFAWLQNREENP